MTYKHFLLYKGYLFVLLILSFVMQKLFGIMLLNLFIFAFVSFTFGVSFKKITTKIYVKKLPPIFSYRGFIGVRSYIQGFNPF